MSDGLKVDKKNDGHYVIYHDFANKEKTFSKRSDVGALVRDEEGWWEFYFDERMSDVGFPPKVLTALAVLVERCEDGDVDV